MLRNFLKSFLLSFLLLAGGAFTAADLPLKAVHFEPPFLCSRAEAAISMTFDEMYAGVSSLGITFSDKLKNSEGQTGLRILLLYSSASLLWRCRLTAR